MLDSNCIINTDWSTKSTEATRIKGGLKFILSLVIYNKVFTVSAKLSDILQAESSDLASAVSVIQATIEIITTIRSECHWNLLWQEEVAFEQYNKIGIDLSRPR